MNDQDIYIDLKQRARDLRLLDKEESDLLDDLRERAAKHPDWNDFETYSMQAVSRLYDSRGVARLELIRKPLFKIAQDLCGRIAVAAGLTRLPDYPEHPTATNKAG